MRDSVLHPNKLSAAGDFNMFSLLYISRFGARCRRRQCYDHNVSSIVGTVGVATVGVSLYRLGTGFKAVGVSYDILVPIFSMAWVGNCDDLCVTEVETLSKPISWHPRVVFWCVRIVSTRRSAFTTFRPRDCTICYTDSPTVCMALLELLCLWLCVWKRAQHQILSRPSCRIPRQYSLVCHSVCSNRTDHIGRITRQYLTRSRFLHIRKHIG